MTARAHHILVIAGGLLCFAAMWLPLWRDYVPARDEYGDLAWLWLLVPAMAVPHANPRVHAAVRWLFIAGGIAGCVIVIAMALILTPVLAVALPVPLLMLAIGKLGKGIPGFVLCLSLVMLVGCFAVIEDDAKIGLAVTAAGALAMFIGAVLWIRHQRAMRFEREAPSLPVAIVRA